MSTATPPTRRSPAPSSAASCWTAAAINGSTSPPRNDRGQITGLTGDLTTPDGFVLERGHLTTFEVPGAQATLPYDINDRGQIVGFSAQSLTATTPSGFLRDATGRFVAINRPGASITVAFGINDRGQIVGIAANPEDLANPQDPNSPPMRMTASPPSAR